MPYLLNSDTSLIKSSVEILLLSCLKRGEKRDSRSSAPWLSLNTDLQYIERERLKIRSCEENMVDILYFKMFRQLSLQPVATDLTDQANGIRYFPSLLQNCLLDFKIFWTVCRRHKQRKKDRGKCEQDATADIFKYNGMR